MTEFGNRGKPGAGEGGVPGAFRRQFPGYGSDSGRRPHVEIPGSGPVSRDIPLFRSMSGGPVEPPLQGGKPGDGEKGRREVPMPGFTFGYHGEQQGSAPGESASSSDIRRETAGVLEHYQDIMGETGLAAFRERVIPQAQSVLADNPQLYSGTLHELVEAASLLRADEVTTLMGERIEPATFEIVRDFDRLREPSSRRYKDLAFHIGDRDPLTQPGDVNLVPLYLRRSQTLPPDFRKSDNPEYYTVQLAADATEDQLAKFLAGHALQNDFLDSFARSGGRIDDFTAVKNNRDTTGLTFPNRWAIAVADRAATQPLMSRHDLATLYSESDREEQERGGLISIRYATSPVPVRTVLIPPTILPANQSQVLQHEGERFFDTRIQTGIVIPGIAEIANREDAGLVYQVAKQEELAIKHALRRNLS